MHVVGRGCFFFLNLYRAPRFQLAFSYDKSDRLTCHLTTSVTVLPSCAGLLETMKRRLEQILEEQEMESGMEPGVFYQLYSYLA